jgi:hypothetical protein
MKDNNRIITMGDEKRQIIDFEESEFVAPEADIYDEPARYYKANLEWAKYIEGHLLTLATIAAWEEATDESYAAIQAIRTFIEGIEMVTQAEMTAAIHDGMYSAINDVAKQIVSGVTSGIVVDEDGNVTVGGAGGSGDESGLPEDDPASPLNEFVAAKAGASIAVRKGINNLLGLLDTLYGVDATADTSEADAAYIISAQFKMDLTALESAITEYWTDRAASKIQLTTIDTLILDSALFCKGTSKQTINTVIVNTTSVSLEARQNATSFVNALSEDQLSIWYELGTEVPSTAYVQYSCVPIDTEEFIFDFSTANDLTVNLAGIWKANHRYLIEASGTFTDSDNPNIVKDFLWSRNTATGVSTFEGFTLNVSGTDSPTSATVPYESSHTYAFTIDKDAANNGGNITKSNGEFSLPNTAGIITLKITDLGEFSV